MPPPPPCIEIWEQNVQGAKSPVGAKRPGGKTSRGGNGLGVKCPGTFLVYFPVCRILHGKVKTFHMIFKKMGKESTRAIELVLEGHSWFTSSQKQ